MANISRRINRGIRKSEINVTAQWVEDRIASETQRIWREVKEYKDVAAVKLIVYEEQLQAIGVLMGDFLAECDDRGVSPRELVTRLAQRLYDICSYVITEKDFAEFAKLTREQIRARLSAITLAYNPAGDIHTVLSGSALEFTRDLSAVEQVVRTAGIPGEYTRLPSAADELDSLLSNVSSEVDDNPQGRRRRR